VTELNRMMKDAERCNERARKVYGNGANYIPPGGINRTSPKKIVIPEDLKKAVILWYNSGKSRKMGVVALDVKEHIFRKIVAESKEALA